MNKPKPEEIAAKPRKALGSIFATSANGKIYEIPTARALEFMITPERAKELGHLPILPYTKLAHPREMEAPTEELGEVVGRHRGRLADGSWGFNRDWVYGTYRCYTNGAYYVGWHRHPWGDHWAVGMDNDDSF